MRSFLNMPYLSGVEMAFSLASLLMALLAVRVNYNNLTPRVLRLFFVASYFTMFIFKTAGLLFWHLHYYHAYFLLNLLFQDQLYVHACPVPYTFWHAYILLGIAISFIAQ